MWNVIGVVAFLSIFESAFAQNQNETMQNQTGNDLAGSGTSFARNLTASISVADADLANKSTDFPDNKLNISGRVETIVSVENPKNIIEFNTHLHSNGTEDKKKLDNFRPSPQLETFYEFNKFPVKPAHPEAKIILDRGIISDERNSYGRGEVLPVINENSRNIDAFEPGFSAFGFPGSTSNVNNKNGPPWTTKNEDNREAPWTSRVRFPSGPNSNDNNPYPFVTKPTDQKPTCCQENNGHIPQHSHSNVFENKAQTNQNYIEHLQPSEASRPPIPINHAYLEAPATVPHNQRGGYLPPVQNFDSNVRGQGASKDRHISGFSSSGPSEEFNFNKLIEVPKKYFSGAPSAYDSHHKTYDPSYNIMEKPSYEIHHKSQGENPWKKILKLLATFIPIGLLISALTPTVITVTNVNDTNTQTRYRASDDSKKELQNHLLSSLNYFDKLNENGCEYRVFCELLVSASHMPDSERHVENLLDNFSKQDIDYKSRAEELKKVFEAVRNQDCNPISCTFIKNPT